MRNEENAIIIYDLGLTVFGVAAVWFLIFQSGLF